MTKPIAYERPASDLDIERFNRRAERFGAWALLALYTSAVAAVTAGVTLLVVAL